MDEEILCKKARIEENIQDRKLARNYLRMVRLLRVPTFECNQHECDRAIMLLAYVLIQSNSVKFRQLTLSNVIDLTVSSFPTDYIFPIYKITSIGKKVFSFDNDLLNKLNDNCDVKKFRIGNFEEVARKILFYDSDNNYNPGHKQYILEIDDLTEVPFEYEAARTIYAIWKFRKDSCFRGMPKDIVNKIINIVMYNPSLKAKLIRNIDKLIPRYNVY